MNAVYPTLGGNAATEAQVLNDLLEDIVTRLEGTVGSASLNIDADVEANGNDLIEIGSLLFSRVTPLTSGLYGLFVSNSDDELYWRNASGVNVQLTSGGSVNVSTSGGITGTGYGSNSNEINFDDANDRYRLRVGAAADDYGSLVCNDVLFNDGSGNYLTLGVPAMAADRTITLPVTYPAANEGLIKINSSGAMSYAVAFTPEGGTLTLTGDLAITGNISVSGTLASGAQTVTGAVTASGNVKGALLKHSSEVTLVLSSPLAHNISNWSLTVNGPDWVNTAGSGQLLYPINLPAGAVITSIRSNVEVSNTKVLGMWFITSAAAVETTVGSDQTVGAGTDTLAITGLSTTVAAANNYCIVFEAVSGTGNQVVYDVRITYTMP